MPACPRCGKPNAPELTNCRVCGTSMAYPWGKPVTPESRALLLSLTGVQKVRVLLGSPVSEVDPVSPLECQFVRAHLTPEENQLLWICL